jgi:ferritin-like metal-binding protein YciE
MLLDKINSPRGLFTYKLGSALKMETTVLDMLGDLEANSQRDELKAQFRHHADETRGQIRNIEMAFAELGEEPDDKPCPAIEGLKAEGKANIKKTDEALVDNVILSGAAETEHHEIAVYEALITHAEAMGKPAVANLLQQNLEQEQHTLEEVKGHAQRLARETAARTA